MKNTENVLRNEKKEKKNQITKKGIKGKIAKNETEIENKATLTHLSALCACLPL